MDNKKETDQNEIKNNYVKRIDYYKKYYISKKKKKKKMEFIHETVTINFD